MSGSNGVTAANGKPPAVPVPIAAGKLDKAWLAEWMKRVSDPRKAERNKQAIHFVLSHWDDTGLRAISNEDLEKGLRGAQRDDRISNIVDDFDRESRSLSSTFPRAQRFQVGAYRTDDPDELKVQDPIDTKTFLQTPDPSTAMGAPGAERPTDAAAMSGQIQRTVDTLSDHIKSQNQLMVDMARSIQEENHRLRELSWNQQVQNQSLLDNQVTRVMDVEERRMKIDLLSRLSIQAMAIGRAWMKSRTGVKEGDALEQMNLEPMQMIQILQILKPAQKAAVKPVIDEFISTLSKEDLEMISQVPELAQALGLPQPPKIEAKAETKDGDQ